MKSYHQAPAVAFGAALVLALTLLLPAGRAQVAPASAPQSAGTESEPIVRMSQFEVTTTQGIGYVSNNSAHGFKTDQPLLDIPQADIVVTQDMLRDIAEDNTSNILTYMGVAAVYEGEPVSLRGTRDAQPFIDDLPDTTTSSDSDYIDSYEIIKGPAQVLYPSAGLSGAVIKSTKKPLDFPQLLISENFTQWGTSKTVIDADQPLGTLGETKLAVRLVAALEDGPVYFTNVNRRQESLHPSFGATYHNTTVRFAIDYDKFDPSHIQNFSLITPSGNLWTGWGRRTDGYPPFDNDLNTRTDGRVEWLQKISSSWENRFEAMGLTSQSYGAVVLPKGAVNWINLSETYLSELQIDPAYLWEAADDVTGKYQIGPIPCQTTAGWNVNDQVTFSEAWMTAPFGTNNVVTVPITTPAGVDAIVVPQSNAYSVPANPGTRTKSLLENIYLQQQIDVIPHWLSLVGGFTWAQIETILDTNLAANSPSYPSTDTTGSQWLHRVGAILHLGKDVAIYALNSQTFSPGAGPTYTNGRLPNVQGQGNEVGLKTAFLDGRISSTISFFHAALTNQSVVATGSLNIAGLTYDVPIGSTTSQGADGDLEFTLVPGWQLVMTGYIGSVRDQTGNEAINATYDSQWTAFTRYDFGHGIAKGQEGLLPGLGVGGGLSRIGSYWQATGGFTVPAGYKLPNPVKMHEGLPIEVFADQKLGKHWVLRVACSNILNSAYVVTGQTPYKVDPSYPQTLSITVTYRR